MIQPFCAIPASAENKRVFFRQVLKALRWIAGPTVWLMLAGNAGAQYAYTDFPGNPPITPRWAFEPWVWNGSAQGTTAAQTLVDGTTGTGNQGYKTYNIPVGAVIIDDPWMTAFQNFTWNTAQYANPTTMITHFRSEGVRVICWTVGVSNTTTTINPPTLATNPNYGTEVANNYAINNNAPYTWWHGSGLGIDFTNPGATNFFLSQNASLIHSGTTSLVSGLKVDQSDSYLGDPITTSTGSIFGRVSNFPRGRFSEYYYAEITNWIQSQTSTTSTDGITFARPFTYQFPKGIGSNAGLQGAGSGAAAGGYFAPPSKFITGWGGDFGGDFDSTGATAFPLQVSNVYTSATSGYSSVGFEIGGYNNTGPNNGAPTHDSLLRQVEFAALLPVMENGGNNGGTNDEEHLPWYWDNNEGYTDTINTYRAYATLHHNLAPFEFDLSVNSNLTGATAITQVYQNQSQNVYYHVLGGSLLTWAVNAASTSSSNTLTLNFPTPAGNRWINWWNHSQVFPGGSATTATYSIDTSPIFVRAGSIIPVNADSAVSLSVLNLPSTSATGSDTVLIFPYQTSQMVYHRPLGDGIGYENDVISVAESGTTGTGSVQVTSPTSQPWLFQIVAFAAPASVTGTGLAGWSYNSASDLLTVSASGSAVNIAISPLPGYSTVPLVSSNDTWTGAGADSNWQTGNNWSGGNSPPIAGDTLFFNGTTQLTNTNNFAASTAFTSITFNATAGAFTLAGNAINLSGAVTDNSPNLETVSLNLQLVNTAGLTASNPAGDLSIGGIISGGYGITETGSGTINLTAANTYTGQTTVSSGVLSLTGNGAINNTAVKQGFLVGSNSGSQAAVYQSGTNTSLTCATAGAGPMQIGSAPGAYGYYNLSGGQIFMGSTAPAESGELDVGGYGAGAGTLAQLDMSGGTITYDSPSGSNSYFITGRSSAAGEIGVINISGGTIQILGSSTDNGMDGLSLNWGANGDTSVVTFSGTGQFLAPNRLVRLNASAGANNTAILNLNGGVLQTMGFSTVSNENEGGIVNFNGGTLEAGAVGGTFLGGFAGTGLASVNIYSGGATINDNGEAIAISQPLLAPVGSGVKSISVSSGGSGYIAPPLVTISGAGNATATAQINPATGQVTNILITNPGAGYSSAPAAALQANGGGTGATLGPVVIGAESSGGLTKQGAGAVTLSGESTYTGATNVMGGTLQAGVASVSGVSGAFGKDSAVTLANVAGVTLALNNFNTEIGSLSGGGSAGGNLTLGSATLTAITTSITSYAGGISGSGGFTVSGSGAQILTGSNSYTGPTKLVGGVLELTGTISNTSSMTIANGATFDLAGGSLSVSGAVTNNGTFAVLGTPALLAAGSFINNGVLDLINGPQTLPGNLTNNGTVLDAGAAQIEQVTMSNSTLSVTVQGYAQHIYQLQRTTTLAPPQTWTNVGAAQTGTGAPLIFTDTGGATGAAGFYRLIVSP